MVVLKLPVGSLVKIGDHELRYLGEGRFVADTYEMVIEGRAREGSPEHADWPQHIECSPFADDSAQGEWIRRFGVIDPVPLSCG